MAPVMLHLPLLLLALVGAVQAFHDGLVNAGYARFLGNFTPPYGLSFLGVPYAQAPVGDLRWRAPQPLQEDVIAQCNCLQEVKTYPDTCVGGVMGKTGSEDCLKINIYTPANATEESKLPVLFYIHGGGYQFGSPNDMPFEQWINFSPNVVIVTVYYRLGAFGFLSHPSFADGSQGDFNIGLKDQIEALKWVKKHISSFGGDPDRVTIDGESAGGGSVMLHLVAKRTEQLFHGAIGQSVARLRMATAEQTLPFFEYYANRLHCNKPSAAATFACLRAVPAGEINAVPVPQSLNNSFYNEWLPAFDNQLFTQYPTVSFQNGQFAHVPIMVGATSNDSITEPGLSLNDTLMLGYPQLTPQDLAEFNAMYPPKDYASEDIRVSNVFGDVTLRSPREIIGEAAVKHSSAFTYRYDQIDPFNEWPRITPNDVGHAAENIVMFLGQEGGPTGMSTHELPPYLKTFSEEFMAYWLSFVRSGNPNTYKLARSPEWPNYATGKRIVLKGDQQNKPGASGSFVEEEPAEEVKRAHFIASKAVESQC